MQSQTIIKIQNNDHDMHFFVYKNKKYPFDFDFFKKASEYFYYNKKELKRTQMIPLVEENEENGTCFNIPELAIQQFIDYVHCKSIPLNNDNITFLSLLAKKYKISSLIGATDEYLNNHHKELALQILLTRQNEPQFETSTYEDIISTNFNEYIKDERIFQLKFSILYRIIRKFSIENKQDNSKSGEKELIDFLFKCLNKYGREASVLFKEINFGEVTSENLNKLLNEYSEVFDFHYINTSLVKTLYETQNNLLKNQIKQEKEINSMKDEMNQIKSDFQRKQEESINSLKEEMNKLRAEFSKQQDENKKNEEENMNLMKEEMSKKTTDFQRKQEESINSVKEEMSKLKTELKKQQDENKKKEEENMNLMKEEMNKNKLEFHQKQEESINSVKEEMSKLKAELKKQQDENKKKEEENSNTIKSIKEEMIKNKSEFHQKPLIEEIDQIKTFLHRMQTSLIFENDICREEFNKIDGESQISLIDEMRSMTNDAIYDKIEGLLIYLSQENKKSKNIHSNYIYIPDKINDENCGLDYSIVGIGFEMTEILFANGKLKSDEFLNIINNFSEFHIEIKYPSDNFDNIFNKIKELKKNFKSKIKISIFITGMQKTDQKFHGNIDIDVVKIDSCIDEILSNGNNGSFEDCSSLSVVSIPKSVKRIGNWAFYICISLKKISIPYSVTEINHGAFSKCSSLPKLTIPPFVSEINYQTIQECSCLTQISIPSFVKSIGNYAFEDCSSLTQITIPSSVKSIGNDAFKGCSTLKQVTIPSSVTSIGNYAFKDCSSLKQITIPSSLNIKNTSINPQAKIICI